MEHESPYQPTSTGVILIAVVLAVVVALLWTYQKALPKPIPGIPHNHHSATRVLGDIPDALRWIYNHNAILSWVVEQCLIHNSPVVQCFMRPFDKPWVVVSDFQEAEDIMVRRTREFDRSNFFGDVFVNVLRGNQVHMPTGDEWRAHRRLMSDTMSVTFLKETVAPHIYTTACLTVDLWHQKARLSKGRPFSVSRDIFKGVLEGVWRAMFGCNPSVTEGQVRYLSSIREIVLPVDIDAPAEIPAATDPSAFTSILELSESHKWSTKSPFPKIVHWLVLHTVPSLIWAKKKKDELLDSEVKTAWESISANTQRTERAIDTILRREVLMAMKDGRAIEWNSAAIKDEILGFLIAGHETTSTVVSWGLKFLSKHQDVQSALRGTLRAEYTRAEAEGDNPSLEEILDADMPYFDATMEEILRCAVTIPGHMRRALVDTEILGYSVPAGTDVFLMVNGPSFVAEPFPIDNELRSRSSREAQKRIGTGSPASISDFNPERWLRRDEQGRLVFDSRGAPMLPFGAGPRGCFGRKLGLLELRIILTLIVWTFDLKEIPEQHASFKDKEHLTRLPEQCFVRLESIT